MKQRVVLFLKLTGILSLFIFFIAGCGRRDVTVDMSVEDRFQRGMRMYEEENYVRAIDEFRIVTRQFAGSDFADDAQYYMAMSYFQRGEYILAANEFETLVNTMSASPLVAEAQYKLALSYYHLSPRYDLDQEYTFKAIDELQAFIDFFPTHELVPDAERKIHELNEKLARKQYENAKLYMRIRYYRAAIRYFEVVIERFHDTQYAELSYIGKVEALMERNMYNEANETLQGFLRQFPNSDQRSRARTLERRIISALSDEDAESEHNNGPAAGNTGNNEQSDGDGFESR